MKKVLLLISGIFFLTSFTFSQADCSIYKWAVSGDTIFSNGSQDIATDSIGNSYVIDFYYEDDFSPQPHLNVSKFDAHGNKIWVSYVIGNASEMGHGISLDSYGNSYITGDFSGTINFGNNTLNSRGGKDIFVAKLDGAGNFIWAKGMGSSVEDSGRDIFTDTQGNSYVTGFFNGTAIFGNDTLIGNGYNDVFVTKIDANGNFMWAKNMGGNKHDEGKSISADKDGNSYIIGTFNETAYFGSDTLISNGNTDIFIVKLNVSGEYVWAKSIGGAFKDEGTGISVDHQGNFVLIGTYQKSIEFLDTVIHASNGEEALLIAKLDSNGNRIWIQNINGYYPEIIYDITFDYAGNTLATGPFTYYAIFGSDTLTNNGGYDIFITKLDTNGNFIWVKTANDNHFGGFSTAISSDRNGNVFVAGFFSRQIIFGKDTLVMNENYNYNSFVTKIGEVEMPFIDYSYTKDTLTVNFSAIHYDHIFYFWDFGDGSPIKSTSNPTHTYLQDGSYYVTLTAIDTCGNNTIKKKLVKVSTAFLEKNEISEINIYPNPTNNQLTIENKTLIKTVRLWDLNGRILENKDILQNTAVLNLEKYKKGIYLVEIITEKGSVTEKIIKN